MRRFPFTISIIALVLLTTVDSFAAKRRSVRGPGPGANPPVAQADTYPASQDTPLVIAAPGVLSNDTANGAAIASYGSTSGSEQTTIGAETPTAQGGTVSLNANGSFTYEPAGAFSGSDSFKYVLGNGLTSTAVVTLIVAAAQPNAVNDSYNATQNTVLSVTSSNGVLDNDTMNGAAIASYGASTGNEQTSIGSNTSTASGGTIKLNASGSFTYTPANNFSGNDSFKYKITNTTGSDTATVTIAVAAPAVDFVVTSPGSFFQFSGVSGQNPVLTLQRGRTYRFQINTSSIHPFEILDAPPGSVTNNDISQGILTFAVPAGAGTYQYNCSIHDFGNTINTVP